MGIMLLLRSIIIILSLINLSLTPKISGFSRVGSLTRMCLSSFPQAALAVLNSRLFFPAARVLHSFTLFALTAFASDWGFVMARSKLHRNYKALHLYYPMLFGGSFCGEAVKETLNVHCPFDTRAKGLVAATNLWLQKINYCENVLHNPVEADYWRKCYPSVAEVTVWCRDF